MSTFNVNERNFQGNTRWTSPNINYNANEVHLEAVLTSSQWLTKTGRVVLGLEESLDGGNIWTMVFELDVAIGDVNGKGGLPNVSYHREVGFQGLIRVYVRPTVTIRLGLTGQLWQ